MILLRGYSIIDALLMLLLAYTFASATTYSILPIIITLCSWAALTLSLEAKHKHAYRATISYRVPIICLVVATMLVLQQNYLALVFLSCIALFIHLYIKKEASTFWGCTSFIWRGLYQASLFLLCITLYQNISSIRMSTILVAIAIFCLYISRNLIADIRDIKFDKLTFSVIYGARASYVVALLGYIAGATTLMLAIPHFVIILPVAAISAILLIYDDGFVLHRIAIMVTSFTFVNIILSLQGTSLLLPNMLFGGILSNFLFYEQVSRPSNPVHKVTQQSRLLFMPSALMKDLVPHQPHHPRQPNRHPHSN